MSGAKERMGERDKALRLEPKLSVARILWGFGVSVMILALVWAVFPFITSPFPSLFCFGLLAFLRLLGQVFGPGQVILPEPVQGFWYFDPEKRVQTFREFLGMGKGAVPFLLRLLTDDDGLIGILWDKEERRQMAALGLGYLREKGAIKVLGRIIVTERSSRVRAAAIWALGEIGDKRGVPFLIPFLGETKQMGDGRWLGEWVAEALWKLGEGEVAEAVLKALEEGVAGPLKEMLARKRHYRSSVFAALLKALDCPSSLAAANAAIVLGALKALEALPKLKRKALSPLTPKSVRQACHRALNALGPFAHLPCPVQETPPKATLPRPAKPRGSDDSFLPRPVTRPLPMAFTDEGKDIR